MSRITLCLLILFLFSVTGVLAQEVLPAFTIKNYEGRILISWKLEYKLPVKTINIQRSPDSVKNYSTIASLVDPKKKENSFTDYHPPHDSMYYRIFIAFEGGHYEFSQVHRPGKPVPPPPPPEVKPIYLYPSKYIYTRRDNNIIVALPDMAKHKYLVRFFDENDKFLFELNKLYESPLIIEKVNFVHAGWFHFELYEDGKLLDKNRFNIAWENKSR